MTHVSSANDMWAMLSFLSLVLFEKGFVDFFLK
jgi:hypothetical protein